MNPEKTFVGAGCAHPPRAGDDRGLDGRVFVAVYTIDLTLRDFPRSKPGKRAKKNPISVN
ncbi:hypothetical protein D3C87_1236840 [compost metagenome]